jgi:hypothetical protein
MPCADLIYIDNSNVVELTELTNSATGTAITNATVTVSLYDSAGVLVTGQTFPAAMSHVSAGTYRATIEDDIVLVEHQRYVAHIDASSSGLVGHWELPVLAKVRN